MSQKFNSELSNWRQFWTLKKLKTWKFSICARYCIFFMSQKTFMIVLKILVEKFQKTFLYVYVKNFESACSTSGLVN